VGSEKRSSFGSNGFGAEQRVVGHDIGQRDADGGRGHRDRAEAFGPSQHATRLTLGEEFLLNHRRHEAWDWRISIQPVVALIAGRESSLVSSAIRDTFEFMLSGSGRFPAAMPFGNYRNAGQEHQSACGRRDGDIDRQRPGIREIRQPKRVQTTEPDAAASVIDTHLGRVAAGGDGSIKNDLAEVQMSRLARTEVEIRNGVRGRRQPDRVQGEQEGGRPEEVGVNV